MDTGVLLAAVVINAIISFIQEGKAETLGSVTVICSDKTGTLTRNEMAVQRVVCAGHVFDVGGVGYAPVGDFSIDGRRIDIHHYPALALAIRAGMLCNDARLREEDELWRVEGDPTEGALLVLGGKAGFTQTAEETAWPRIDRSVGAGMAQSTGRWVAGLRHGGTGKSRYPARRAGQPPEPWLNIARRLRIIPRPLARLMD